jgi:hypothetical protein
MRTIEDYNITEKVPVCIVRDQGPVPETRDPKEITQRILDHIKENAEFCRRFIPGIHEKFREMTGILSAEITLDQCRKLCGLNANDDTLILKVLENLARSGRLVFSKLETRRNLHFNDIHLEVEFCQVTKTTPPDSTIFVHRFYPEAPLKSSELKRRPESILDLRDRIAAIRGKRDQHFKRVFGWYPRAAEIERAMAREDREAAAELQRDIRNLMRALTEKGKTDAKI